MREISRSLYTRGIHRMFGSPTLGTVSGFLTVVFLIRAGVNLYFVYYISGGSAVIDLNQIGGGWYACIGGYLAACSSLSAFHISFALPSVSFLNFSSGGRRFSSMFMRQAALLRPMNIAVAVLAVIGSFVFLQAGGGLLVIALGIVLLSASALGGWFVFKIAERIQASRQDVQVTEVLILFALVMLNPDVGARADAVNLIIGGTIYPFGNLFTAAAVPGCALAITIILLFLIKAVSSLSGLFQLRIQMQPLESWYWQYFRPKFWIFIYLIIVPVLLLPVISFRLKVQAAAVYVFITAFRYVLFLSHCDNSLREKLRVSLLSKARAGLILPSLRSHIILTIIPLTAIVVSIY